VRTAERSSSSSSDRTPEEFRTDYRRDQILAAARRVMAAVGFDGMSIGEVVKAAGLSRGTFYGYFTSKDELLAALLTSGREILAKKLREEVDRDANLEEQLAGFLRVCLSRVDASREFFLAAAGLQSRHLSTNTGELGALIRDFDSELMRILDDASMRGEVPPGRMSDARQSFATLVMGAMTSRSLQVEPRPVREVAAVLARFAVKGLAT
jgi:AcrR family transcriptional regulator